MNTETVDTLDKEVKLVFGKQTPIDGAIAEAVYKQVIESGKSEVVLINIGTDLIVGDCLGPVIGSSLLNKLDNIHVYGTLDSLINAKTIKKSVEDILNLHKDAYIIAVDACVNTEPAVGAIVFSNKPVKAGGAFRDDLISVGDCSIKGVVSLKNDMNSFMSSVRLSLVMELARKIELELIELDNLLKHNLYDNNDIEFYVI